MNYMSINQRDAFGPRQNRPVTGTMPGFQFTVTSTFLQRRLSNSKTQKKNHRYHNNACFLSLFVFVICNHVGLVPVRKIV